MIKFFFCAFACSFFLFSNAQAALVIQDDAGFGHDTLTLDTDTNFLWLDLSFTSNLSRGYVSTQFGEGGDFSGYRYATADEVTALVNEALSVSADVFEAVEYLGSLVGITKYQSGYPEILAQIDTGKSAGANFLYSNGTPTYQTGVFGTTYGSGFSSSGVSSWLVKEASAVPVPAAAWLLGAGLAGLAGMRRKRLG